MDDPNKTPNRVRCPRCKEHIKVNEFGAITKEGIWHYECFHEEMKNGNANGPAIINREPILKEGTESD